MFIHHGCRIIFQKGAYSFIEKSIFRSRETQNIDPLGPFHMNERNRAKEDFIAVYIGLTYWVQIKEIENFGGIDYW